MIQFHFANASEGGNGVEAVFSLREGNVSLLTAKLRHINPLPLNLALRGPVCPDLHSRPDRDIIFGIDGCGILGCCRALMFQLSPCENRGIVIVAAIWHQGYTKGNPYRIQPIERFVPLWDYQRQVAKLNRIYYKSLEYSNRRPWRRPSRKMRSAIKALEQTG